MGKKKGNQDAGEATVKVAGQTTFNPMVEADAPGIFTKYSHLFIALAIGLITFLVYKVCLDNLFVSWDDPGYITENPLVRDISGNGLRQIFSTPVMGNYHPVTMLSLALEYHYVQLEPWLYHLDSLLLHIVVTMLVYWLAILVTKRPIAAAITALLFALHPMHVESVAWVSARKDVLYGCFYIAALIAYIYYTRMEGAKRWMLYFLTIVLFVLALLAKPVAVVLPVVLLLIDHFWDRKRELTMWLDKVPFFLLALGAGLKSVHDQKEIGVVSQLNDHFSIIDTVTMGCYTLGTYLWKAILPVGLSCFYPYPPKVNNLFPVYFYVFPFAVAALFFIMWKFGRKNKMVLFGSLFFLVNIVLLLQFVPVGNAIIAERYTYIAYIGLFLMAGYGIALYLESGRAKLSKPVVFTGVALVCLTFGYWSNARCKAWYDSDTLWSSQLDAHPENEYAYNSKGVIYFERWKTAGSAEEEKLCYDSAQYLLNKAVQINPDYVNPYMSLGVMARVQKRYDEAKYDFRKVMILDNGREAATGNLGMGIVYFILRDVDSSAYYLKRAIQLKPDLQPAHANYANLLDLTEHTEEALKEYGIAIALAPRGHESYLNRGRVYYRMGRISEAFADINKAVDLKPTSGESYYARALCYGKMGDKQAALQDLEMASNYGYGNIDKDFYESLQK